SSGLCLFSLSRGRIENILSAMNSSREKINVLAYQEGEAWVAQCVEYDIYARAHSLPELPERLSRAIAVNLCINEEFGRSGLSGIPAAPQGVQEAFRRAKMDISGGIWNANALVPGITIGETKVADHV